MKEAPAVTIRQECDASGGACLVVEIEVTPARQGELLLIVDLSDSTPVTESDVGRLPRLLTSLPRQWRATVASLGNSVDMQGRIVTIGDLVDGAFDLRASLFDSRVIAMERSAGSFLGPVVRRFLGTLHPGTELVALVLTDGRLADVDPIRTPEGMRMIGLAPDQGVPDRLRWDELLPGVSLIGRDTQRDAISALRAAAGCGFYGPCDLVLPSGDYRVRKVAGDAPISSARRIAWDFSLQGRLALEFALDALPEQLLIQGTDGLEARIPIQKPAQSAAESIGRDEEQKATHTVSPEAIVLAIDRNEAITLLRQVRARAESRESWQSADGRLAIAFPTDVLATSLVDEAGCPRADSYLLITRDVEDDADVAEMNHMLIIPLRRDVPLAFSTDIMTLQGETFSASSPWKLHFDRLENRWMLSMDGAAPAPLPPRVSQELFITIRDGRGAPCCVFYSGSLHKP